MGPKSATDATIDVGVNRSGGREKKKEGSFFSAAVAATIARAMKRRSGKQELESVPEGEGEGGNEEREEGTKKTD